MKLNEICCTLYGVAPLHLAQSWDNVGLLAGDEHADCRSILLTIDLTPAVLDEAVQSKVDLILTYHPPIFKPIASLRAHSSGTDALVWKAIRHNIAIYSPHTALDAADGGTNDVLAEACGAVDLRPIEFTDDNKHEYKLVVFVTPNDVDKVAEAISSAGAGVIGEYTRCSFRSPGTGTFLGSGKSSPSIGRPGSYETVEEIRLEMVVLRDSLAAVVQALRSSHPYEEPAFDIYPLQPRTVPGSGRIGALAAASTPAELLHRLRQTVPTTAPLLVGDSAATIDRVAVCAGAVGSLLAKLKLGPADCLVTGELRHHDALSIRRLGSHAIVLGHWASERPVLQRLAATLRQKLPDLRIAISQADADPFRTL